MAINTELILQARENGTSKNALILQILWDWLDENPNYKKKGEEI